MFRLTPWKHQKTLGFLIFPGVSKEKVLRKWVTYSYSIKLCGQRNIFRLMSVFDFLTRDSHWFCRQMMLRISHLKRRLFLKH